MRGLFAFSGPPLFLTAYLLLAHVAILRPHETMRCFGAPCWLCLAFAVPAIYGLWLLNVNFSAPHRFYRNRLSETYLVCERRGSAEARGSVVSGGDAREPPGY